MIVIMTSKIAQINELMTRGIAEIIPSPEALSRAISGEKKLRVYFGIDPTSPHIHLGHSIPLLLLKRFQKLGHHVTLLIGDFTARIGDPSGKGKTRPPLAADQVLENVRTYKKQAEKILDFDSKENPVALEYNSTWLEKMSFGKVLELASGFTIQQMLARDMFQKRMKEESPIGVHEFLYPLMQGYDSVALETDVEVGGNDQLFNMLVGRDLVNRYLKKEKFVLATRLLVNPVTGAKMSKTEGNVIALDESAGDMYGKVMAFPDEITWECFELCTEVGLQEIEKLKSLHPRDAKTRLAREITKMYHGADAAEKAGAEFEKVFGGKEIPSKMPEFTTKAGKMNSIELLVETSLAGSKSEARRLIEQGGVHVQWPNDKKWHAVDEGAVIIKDKMIIRVGPRRFMEIRVVYDRISNSQKIKK